MASKTKIKAKAWLEATRLHTLPVSVAGVLAAVALSLTTSVHRLLPGSLCLSFAVMCQIASNFANEYFDFKAGLDRPGRDGFRRGVSEGDISSRAMLAATIAILAVAAAIGLSLIYWGGWWLIAVGVLVIIGAIAYSAGPYPLSRHGLGELAVIIFFGIVPVNMTYFLMTATVPTFDVVATSIAIGLMGANVLIVNNYRDIDDDKAGGKQTLAVMWGRTVMESLYLFSGFIAVALMVHLWSKFNPLTWFAPAVYLAIHTYLYFCLIRRRGPDLNPLLGKTAAAMLLYIVLLFFSVLFS